MNVKSILCVSLVGVTVATAVSDQEGDKGTGGPVDYEFGYNVYDPNSDDIKSHHEIREGKNVYGFYTFKEADGSIRIVKYKVGPTTGFEATVEKLKPGQKIVIRKPDSSQDPEIGQSAGHVEEDVQNEIDDRVVPQYVGGGSRSQYVLGIINNPLQDIPLPNGGHGQQTSVQDYQQPLAVAPDYGQRQNSVRSGRHRNQYVAPNPARGNRGHGYGQRQVQQHGQGYRQPHGYIQAPTAVYGNQYPVQPRQAQGYIQRPLPVRGGARRNPGYVKVQEQLHVNDIRSNGQVQDLGYAPNDGDQGQVVDQGYAVNEEAETQENAEEQNNNADVKDESEQEDDDEFEDEFKADLEEEDEDGQADEEEAEHLEEEDPEQEYVEEATEVQEKKTA